MTTVVQSTYRTGIRKGIPGMVSDQVGYDAITRICQDSAGIGFGVAVSQGSTDKAATIGGTKFLGITMRDITLVPGVANDPNSDTLSPVDVYPQYLNMGIMTRGHIWVVAHADVAGGDPLFYSATDGTLTNSASGEAASGSIAFSAQPTDGQTVTVNGTAITFKASGALSASSQVNIAGTLGDTVTALANFITSNPNSDTGLAQVKVVADPPSVGGGAGANTLLVAASAVGVGAAGPPKTGNSITLATNVTGATVSGATLSGGTAAATAVPSGYWVDSAISGQIARVSLAIQR